MKLLRTLSMVWLIAVICFVWGFLTVKHKVFPWKPANTIHKEIIQFIAGHDEEETSTSEKILNDLNLVPERQLTEEFPEAEYNRLASQQPNSRLYQGLTIDNLNQRRLAPIYYKSKAHDSNGYYFMFGPFDFDQHVHGALLLNNRAEVIHSWVFDETPVKKALLKVGEKFTAQGKAIPESRIFIEPENRFPHGVALYPDGSIIYNDGDPGNAMRKIDFCGNPVWHTLGKFNHAVQPDQSNNTVWTFENNSHLVSVHSSTGERVKSISWDAIRAANNDIGLDLRYLMLLGEWWKDPFHFNDVEPLPENLAHAYPMFKPGDLLISLRALNLVAVVDPDTLKIKWWRVGAVRRQHDPDWHESGKIIIFNNNMRVLRNPDPWESDRFSNIIAIDPNTYKTELRYDGRRDNFHSDKRGKHQVLANNNFLITSTQQGRVIEVTPAGEIVFEFINRYDSNRNLVVSEAQWIPENFFEFDIKNFEECSN